MHARPRSNDPQCPRPGPHRCPGLGRVAGNPRAAAAIQQEDGTWILTVAGYNDDAPAADVDGLRAFGRSVDAPEIGALLDSRQPLHDPLRYRFAHSVRRRIENVSLPVGYAVIGDAIASFNPVIGQGMSVAALEAVELRRQLGRAHSTAGLPRALSAYHRAAGRCVNQVWTLVVGADLNIPGVRGQGAPRPRRNKRLRCMGATDRRA